MFPDKLIVAQLVHPTTNTNEVFSTEIMGSIPTFEWVCIHLCG